MPSFKRCSLVARISCAGSQLLIHQPQPDCCSAGFHAFASHFSWSGAQACARKRQLTMKAPNKCGIRCRQKVLPPSLEQMTRGRFQAAWHQGSYAAALVVAALHCMKLSLLKLTNIPANLNLRHRWHMCVSASITQRQKLPACQLVSRSKLHSRFMMSLVQRELQTTALRHHLDEACAESNSLMVCSHT